MQNDIDANTKTTVTPKIAVRINSEFQATRKIPKKSKEARKKSAGKMIIAELGKGFEKYDLINNFAQAEAGTTFSHISRMSCRRSNQGKWAEQL